MIDDYSSRQLPGGRLDGQDAVREGTQDFNHNDSLQYLCRGRPVRTHTVFGQVARGMEVEDKIVAAARDEFDNPLEPIAMTMTVKE